MGFGSTLIDDRRPTVLSVKWDLPVRTDRKGPRPRRDLVRTSNVAAFRSRWFRINVEVVAVTVLPASGTCRLDRTGEVHHQCAAAHYSSPSGDRRQPNALDQSA